MKNLSRRLALAGIASSIVSAPVLAQLRMRYHTATERLELALGTAGETAGRNQVTITAQGNRRVITSNGIPAHMIGRFPNSGNPHAVTAQRHRFEMPVAPKKLGNATAVGMNLAGVAINGVPFDPGAAEFWHGDPRSGWQYDALGGAVALGLDANYGHVQPTGAYHYHGLPIGLLQSLGWSMSRPSPLVGYASDGFPIYAITADVGGRIVEMTSSYRLRGGQRPSGGAPSGTYDGTFVQDYLYTEGAGALDQANGAFVTTQDYPDGTYAYFLTRSYPVLPRMTFGRPDTSFAKRRG